MDVQKHGSDPQLMEVSLHHLLQERYRDLPQLRLRLSLWKYCGCQVGTDWEGSQSREPLSLWMSSGNIEGNIIEYICEATLLSEGLGTRKTTRAPLLYSGIHSKCPQKLPWGGSAQGPKWTKKCFCAGKKPSQNELCWFLQGATHAHSLI